MKITHIGKIKGEITMNKQYENFIELTQNAFTGADLLSDDNLSVIMEMLGKANEMDDYRNMNLIIQDNDQNELTNIEIFYDDDTPCFQVGGRTPHDLINRGTLNIASLKNDLRAELRKHRDQIIEFNCGLISDMYINPDIGQEMEEIEETLGRNVIEIMEEDQRMVESNMEELMEENTMEQAINEIITEEIEDGYDSYDFETDLYDTPETPEDNGIQIGTRDIENTYRLEQSILEKNINYRFEKTADGEYRVTNLEIPGKYNIIVSKHGIILPTDAPTRTDDIDIFNKMVDDVRNSVADELEMEGKETYYNDQRIAGYPSYQFIENLCKEYENNGRNEVEKVTFINKKNEPFIEVSVIGDKENPEIEFRFAEEYGGAAEKIPFDIESINDNVRENPVNDKFIEFLENAKLMNEIDQLGYEIRSGETITARSDKKQREFIKITNEATLGKNIDATIDNIRSLVSNDIMPVLRTAQKTLSTANHIRQGIIRGYKDGVLSGFEILPGIKDMKEGWKAEWSVDTLKNALTGAAVVELRTAKEDWLLQNGKDPSEAEKYKEELKEVEKEFFKTKMPNLFNEYETGKTLSKAVLNLEKQYYELSRAGSQEDRLKAAKIKQEIYFARNNIEKDMEEFRRAGLNVKMRADRAVEELCRIKENIRAKRLERKDLNRAKDSISKFRNSITQMQKRLKERASQIKLPAFKGYKDFLTERVSSMKERNAELKRESEKVINCESIEERNMAELINDSFIKAPMTEKTFIATFGTNNFYEELEYKEHIYNREMRNVDESSLNEISLAKKKSYEKAIEQKEIVDQIAKGIMNVKEEILGERMERDAAVEKLATAMRNVEASINAMNNIDNTEIFNKLNENEKNGYREVAESIIKNDPDLSRKDWGIERDTMERDGMDR